MAKVFVITGPSGVGKGSLIRLLRERVPELSLSTSHCLLDKRTRCTHPPTSIQHAAEAQGASRCWEGDQTCCIRREHTGQHRREW